MADAGAGGDRGPDSVTRSPPSGGSAVRRWLAVAAFVLGFFAGAVVAGLLGTGSTQLPDDATAAAVPAVGAESTQSSAPLPGGAPQILVNQACLRALNGAQDVYSAVDELSVAAAELNAARLDEVVRRLQPLQGRLEKNIDDCQVVTRSTDGSSTTSEPAVSTGAAPPS